MIVIYRILTDLDAIDATAWLNRHETAFVVGQLSDDESILANERTGLSVVKRVDISWGQLMNKVE